ncbi:MAG: HD-GYP domain-containing protein, partial [Dehalococcoidales bacterium]|nr:HD-GYP domain-containing protein [Dehalococcoidales bacterium]
PRRSPLTKEAGDKAGRRDWRAALAEFYTVFITLAGPGVAVAILVNERAVESWTGVLAFALFAVVAEALAVDVYSQSKVSSSFVATFAGVLLFGVPSLVASAFGVAVLRGVLFRFSLRRAAFDFGVTVLAGAGVWAIFRAFDRSLTLTDLPYLALPLAAAGMAYFLVCSGLTAQAIALDQRRGMAAVWNDLFRWLGAHYLLMTALAVTMATAYEAYGVYSILAFVIPSLAMRYAFKQYVDRTASSVNELRKANEHLKSTYENTLLALVAALDARDHETEGHSERVANYAIKIGEQMGLERKDIIDLHLGALLHDIGKIGLPDTILRKRGPLTDKEWEQIRNHPRTGFEILQGIEFLDGPSQIVVCHHERFDGKGYPLGLARKDIPLLARIFAVADTFDAMTSDRPYRPAEGIEGARIEIEACSGSQFDPDVVEAFVQALPKLASGLASPVAPESRPEPEKQADASSTPRRAARTVA